MINAKRFVLVALIATCVRFMQVPAQQTRPVQRIRNTAQGVWVRGGGWRLVPDIRIGEVEGPENTTFAAISGVEADDAGRIYILDRQANQLRIFAPNGSHLQSIGRSGAGPGEFSAANGLRWMGRDTLLVVDQRGNRYSILTRDGKFVRSVVRGLGFFGWMFRGGYDNGNVYELSATGQPPNIRPILLATSLRDGTSASNTPAPTGVTRIDTVNLPTPGGSLYESFSIRTARGGMVMAVPFAPEPVYFLDGKGSVWHGHGNAFRILHSTFAGDTLMDIEVNAQPAAVKAEDLEEWKATAGVKQFTEMGGKLDLDRIPRVKPFFDGIHVDPEGFLWVSQPAGAMEMAFAVIDGRGRYLGRVQATGVKRDVYVPFVVRNRKLYVVGRDDFDVPHVYVYRIEGR